MHRSATKGTIGCLLAAVVARSGAALLIAFLVACTNPSAPTGHASSHDPLPSWNDGPAKRSIVAFVAKVTTAGTKDFVEPAARIATFDNDGTLWSEQPLYFQFQFSLDQVKLQAAQHPEWQTT